MSRCFYRESWNSCKMGNPDESWDCLFYYSTLLPWLSVILDNTLKAVFVKTMKWYMQWKFAGPIKIFILLQNGFQMEELLINVLDEGMDSNQDTVLRYIFDILGMKKNLKVIIINIQLFFLSLYEKRIRSIIWRIKCFK